MKFKAFISITFLFMFVVGCDRSGGQSVARYIQATQKRDFKTVVDLTYQNQEEIRSIKANNPQSLWPNLIRGYYDSHVSALSSQPAGLFVPSCKWTITEKRSGKWGSIPITITYVNLSYPSPAESPIWNMRRLRQGVLAFNVATSGQIISIDPVPAGDVFWPIPTLTSEAARDLANSQMDDTALHLHLTLSLSQPAPQDTGDGRRWVSIAVPWVGPTWNSVKLWHSNYRAFLEKWAFNVGPFNETPEGQGAGAQVQPPSSWSRYELRGQNRQSVSRAVSYLVDENTEIEIVDLTGDQQLGFASAKVKLVHSGCNEVCKFVRETSQTPQFGHPFAMVVGNNHWGLFQGSDSSWPDVEEGTINYVFDEGSLQWIVGPGGRNNI
jgi:hypothetical protein